jgi:MFS family permease
MTAKSSTSSDASPPQKPAQPAAMSRGGRRFVLAVVFLGWMFAGVEMALFPLATGPIITDFSSQRQAVLPEEPTPNGHGDVGEEAGVRLKKLVGKWFTRYIAAFLFGAAAGGALFGQLGDRAGRVTAMGLSILCYSVVTGVGFWARSPEQLLVLRFVACLGIGGMWPNGVSLASEAWPDVSRPALAGLIGAAANVGFMLLSIIATWFAITPDSWRWVMLVGASPALLGVLALACVPESPRWLAARGARGPAAARAPFVEVFRPPLARRTVVGVCLGAIPLLGGWGASKWIVLWADEIGRRGPVIDEELKGATETVWSIGATLGSLAGGWLASRLGRRTTYFLVSLGSVLIAGYIFRQLTPGRDAQYMVPVFLLGLVATIYFGWLPLYLPELFPTRVRATGAGVSFNFGRIASAIVILTTGALVEAHRGQYEKVGAVTSLIYAVGMLVIFFAPKTTGETLKD